MEFKTYVHATKEYNLGTIYSALIKSISVVNPKAHIDKERILQTLEKSKGSHFFSRYGLDDDIIFADSELINAYQQGECYLEYLQYRYDFKYYPLRHKLADFPLVLAVEASSRCNLRCQMCFQTHMDEQSDAQNRGILPFKLYQKFLDELKDHKLYSIVFASRGEPLLNPLIDKMISEAKKQGVLDIKLNTNAALLTEEISRKLLASGLDLLVFSVDSIVPENYFAIRGIKLEPVLRNIENFLWIKKQEFPDSKMKVRVAMVVTKPFFSVAEHEVEAAKDFWLTRVDELSVKSEADFIHIYDAHQSPVALHTCNLLWERMYLWYDGRVNPCDIDHLSTLCVGDLSKGDTIHNIWNGSAMQRLRSEHLNNRVNLEGICRHCEGY
jgi:radical SAM protein with 4Fe4S-binding SPASM domain